MNPSESLSQDHFIEHFHSASSVFPPLIFLEETLCTPSDQWVKGLHVLDPMLMRLRAQDLPGKKEVEAYVRHQYRRNCRPNTIRGSYICLEAFLKFFKARGKSSIEEIARDDLEGFVEHEQDRGLKLSTVRLRLATLKAFLRFLIEEGVGQDNNSQSSCGDDPAGYISGLTGVGVEKSPYFDGYRSHHS